MRIMVQVAPERIEAVVPRNVIQAEDTGLVREHRRRVVESVAVMGQRSPAVR